ncbi:hypothetical protein GGF42_000592 [Coemansia sp. RSA 2424]|nr:hypothetical protein GGF42_000592 [Coemansia sp. RSA 2424]
MALLAPFQLLPQHVVRIVTRHVANSSRLRFDGIYASFEEDTELLMPLLWVCRNFRAVVYAKYCSKYNIYLSYEQGGEKPPSWPLWPRCLGELDHHTPNSVRELHFVVSIQSISSGEALDRLSHAPFDTCAFPKAGTISCIFDLSLLPPYDAELTTDIEANVCAFVSRVKQIIPSPKDVCVQPSFVDTHMPQASGYHYGSLVTQLFQLASRVSYLAMLDSLPMELQADNICGLVHFSYQSSSIVADDHTQAMHIARRNAPTLQLLCIAAALDGGVSALVQASDGNYVNYRSLHSLDLNVWRGPPASLPPAARGVVLFPRLVNLSIPANYPFSDDLPFRGNSATLGFLSVLADREVCDILRRYKVFTPTSHPGLLCVEIELPPNSIPHHFESSEACMQFVLSIGPNASRRDIHGISFGEDLSSALSLIKNHTCIHGLSLPDTPLMLWDIEFLTRSLPLLSDLLCKATGLGLMTEDIALDDCAAFMCSLSSPERKRFRCWRLNCVENDDDDLFETVQCVLFVALMCPNLTHVAVHKKVSDRFMALMEQTIESGGFKQHSPRLRCLLPN